MWSISANIFIDAEGERDKEILKIVWRQITYHQLLSDAKSQ